MTAPAVTETPDSSLSALDADLRVRGISAVPIVEADGRLVGIVSTRDILRAPADACARDVMSTVVITASIDEALDAAARRLVAARVHRTVVMDGKRVAGVLSARDVLAATKGRRLDEPISRAMTSPVSSIELGSSIDEAIARLAAANVHGLVVVDGDAPVGVFTHAEALAARKLAPMLLAGPVEGVMSRETICLDASTSIHRAASYAIAMNVRRILVVERRRLVGIVSAMDLVSVLCRVSDDGSDA